MNERKNWKRFNVAGVTFANDGMKITRLEWIAKYCVQGSTFELEREPEHPADANAIKVLHVLAKSGKRMQVGYVPAKLAAELAPLMDEFNWKPAVKFGMKHLDKDTGYTMGLQLRYPTR